MRNLNLEELFIGAWVKRFIPEQKRFTCPMYISGLFWNDTMYLETNPEYEPIDAELKEIYPITMDEESLRGFGFVKVPRGENVWMKSVKDIRLTISLRQKHGALECRRAAISGRFACWNEEIRYIHELQSWWRDKVLLPYGLALNLEWNDSVEQKEELG